jgi:hypothetical protein
MNHLLRHEAAEARHGLRYALAIGGNDFVEYGFAVSGRPPRHSLDGPYATWAAGVARDRCSRPTLFDGGKPFGSVSARRLSPIVGSGALFIRGYAKLLRKRPVGPTFPAES